jgi:flagellar basal body rod protein FlgG
MSNRLLLPLLAAPVFGAAGYLGRGAVDGPPTPSAPATTSEGASVEVRLRVPLSLLGKTPRKAMGHQGTLVNTQQSLDVAIDGAGYFCVQRPNGDLAYTRRGSLRLNARGEVVAGTGNVILPTMTVPIEGTAIVISPDGTVSCMIPGSTVPTQVAQFTLTRFLDPRSLVPVEDGLFVVGGDTPGPITATPGLAGTGFLRQGFVECDDEDLARQIVDLLPFLIRDEVRRGTTLQVRVSD